VLSHGEPRYAAVKFDMYRILQKIDNRTFMYAKHGNLVDADASGAKAITKHLESRLKVIQGHAFCDHWNADERLRITSNVNKELGLKAKAKAKD